MSSTSKGKEPDFKGKEGTCKNATLNQPSAAAAKAPTAYTHAAAVGEKGMPIWALAKAAHARLISCKEEVREDEASENAWRKADVAQRQQQQQRAKQSISWN